MASKTASLLIEALQKGKPQPLQAVGKIGAAQTEEKKSFASLVSSIVSDGGEKRLQHFLKSKLPVKIRDEFWSLLSERVTERINASEIDGEEETIALKADVRFLLAAVTCVENGVLAGCKQMDQMREITSALNEVLYNLRTETASKLQNAISRLCEVWYSNDMGGDEYMPNVIPYLLARTLEHDATASDLKRIYKIRDALSLLDFEDDSINTASTQGILFLASLFSLHDRMMQPLHSTIKSQIPFATDSQLRAYGLVYYQAWKQAEQVWRETELAFKGSPKDLKEAERNSLHARIEKNCLQDIVALALYGKDKQTARNSQVLLKMLSSRQADTGALLLRLWGPTLFRSLKAPNIRVRRNAARIFASVFPLTDPESKAQYVEKSIQFQCGLMHEILADDDAVVRTSAVESVCRGLGLYWELLPSDEAGKLLKKIINDMACDASSSSVRLAVVIYNFQKTLKKVLKAVLPHTKKLFHDTAQSVRKAYIELLQKVSSLKGIKFFDVVEMKDLLVRLGCDGSSVAKLLVRLLQPSYFPFNQSVEIQVERVLKLAEFPAAAKVFFAYVHQFVPLKAVCHLLASLCKALTSAKLNIDTKKLSKSKKGKGGGLNDDEKDDEREELAIKAATRNNAKETAPLSNRAAKRAEILLLCMAQLWTRVEPKLRKKSKAKLQQYLEQIFDDKTLGLLLEKYGKLSQGSHAAIYKFVTFLPANSIPKLTRSSIEQLGSLEQCASSKDYGHLLQCVFTWGQQHGMVCLIAESLAALAESLSASDENGDEEQPLDPTLAAKFLHYILKNEESIQKDLCTSDSVREALVLAFKCHCDLRVFCCSGFGESAECKRADENGNEGTNSEEVPVQLSKTFDFITEIVLPEAIAGRSFDHKKGDNERKRSKRRRSFEEASKPGLVNLGMCDPCCPMPHILRWSRILREEGIHLLPQDFQVKYVQALSKAIYQYALHIERTEAGEWATGVLCEAIKDVYKWNSVIENGGETNPKVIQSFSDMFRHLLKLDYSSKIHPTILSLAFSLSAADLHVTNSSLQYVKKTVENNEEQDSESSSIAREKENKKPSHDPSGVLAEQNDTKKTAMEKNNAEMESLVSKSIRGYSKEKNQSFIGAVDISPITEEILKNIARYPSKFIYFKEAIQRLFSEQNELDVERTGLLVALYAISHMVQKQKLTYRHGAKSMKSLTECVKFLSI
eukprot:jgi/Bigna1/85037/estExt_fgenesh1_pg.C_20002